MSAPVFWLVSFLFERYIDAPSIKFAKYVGALYRGERSLKRPNPDEAKYPASLTFFRRRKKQ